ncbi:MAG: hypothetical protein V8S08_11725 [Lachnoclostridium sp.]
MKENKKNPELEITVENFMNDLTYYRQENVRVMLRNGILEKIDEADKISVYKSIFALCDKKIAEQLFKHI